MNRLTSFIRKRTQARSAYNKTFRPLGVPFADYCDYHFANVRLSDEQEWSELFGLKIKRINSYSYIHTIEGIFVEHLYRFSSSSDRPLVLDCGANIGLSTIYFKRLFPNARVVAFEPDAKIFSACRHNLDAFGFTDVELVNAAVWTSDGTLEFLPDNGLGGMVVESAASGGQAYQVAAVDLKKYLTADVDFLKIDIEGSELAVLTDCSAHLPLVRNLFVEYHSRADRPQQLQELLAILTTAGFRYYIKHAWDYLTFPFVDHEKHRHVVYDLQLNIFAYRA